MNVNLSSTFEDYIKQQLDTGTYNNASEVVRESLRLKMQQDELYQAKVEAMRLALIAGEQSGEATPLNIQDVIQKVKTEQGLNA